MAAGVRLGWIVAAPNVIAHLSGLKTDFGTNTLASHIAAEFAGSGTLAEHITQLKQLYHHRRDVMLAALEADMPDGTRWTIPTGGFFIWLTLPGGMTCNAIAPLARERGVSVGLGTMFYANGGGDHEIRLSYSFNDDETIRKGVKILGDLLKEQLAVRAE